MTEKQFHREVQRWVERFRLQEWDVQTEMLEGEGVSNEDASQVLFYKGHLALIATGKSGSAEDQQLSALHEVLHIALHRLSEIAHRVAKKLPEELRAEIDEQIQMAEEATVIRLTRGITELLEEGS